MIPFKTLYVNQMILYYIRTKSEVIYLRIFGIRLIR